MQTAGAAGYSCFVPNSSPVAVEQATTATNSATASAGRNGWLLLFRQKAGTYKKPASQWLRVNSADPTQPNYSILDSLGTQHRSTVDSKFTFKIVWPMRTGANANVWKQSTNPVTDLGAVGGYEPVDVRFTDNGWGGLENGKRHSSSPYALLDGTVNHGNWFYAVGSSQAWGGGIPGAKQAESVVELYVYIGGTHAWKTSSESRVPALAARAAPLVGDSGHAAFQGDDIVTCSLAVAGEVQAVLLGQGVVELGLPQRVVVHDG